MPCGHLNAMRFAQKPLGQPAYAFCDVPKARSDLQYSQIQRIDNREHFQACMAEMLLLGKEAVRRRRRRRQTAAATAGTTTSSTAAEQQYDIVQTNSGAKPLSLEYLADRMDVDDPCFGYLVRTHDESPDTNNNNNNNNNCGEWKRGMLQGFITVTTFTNWQATFRWNSLHPDAFGCDPPSLRRQRLKGQRKWDLDGSLAKELQATVHAGDVWNEGIVWPRIAEISLLGGLGCGRTLVKLAIEELESIKASDSQNYDYVVLQATDNSIPFYESLGFVRVGGIMEDKPADETESDNASSDPQSGFIISDVMDYTTKKRGEQIQEIAKKLRVNVWDILFLNKGTFGETMAPSSKLLLGTTIKVPEPPKKERRAPTRVSSRVTSPVKPYRLERSSSANENNEPTQEQEEENEETPTFYTAKENDTPTQIAKKFGVNCQALIRANANRLPGLIPKSRLRNGTRVQVSHFHIKIKKWIPYAHWSFPDNDVEDGEPSYMMCYKLQRRHGKAQQRHKKLLTNADVKNEKSKSVVESLKAKVVNYTPTPLVWMPDLSTDIPDGETRSLLEFPAKIEAKPLASTPRRTARHPKSPSTPIVLAKKHRQEKGTKANTLSDDQPGKHFPVQASKVPADKSAPVSQLHPPKRHMSSFVLFCQDMRKRKAELLKGMSIADASRVLADRWQKAPPKVKQQYEQEAAKGKKEYLVQKEEYDRLCAIEKKKQVKLQEELDEEEQFQRRESIDTGRLDTADKKEKARKTLYNKIVKVKPEAMPLTKTPRPKAEVINKDSNQIEDPTSSPELQPEYYKYWFVLTYIPDLQWCHLVPLVQVGEFTSEDKKMRLVGRPKWKLVHESLCQEIDISSRYVVSVKSCETKKSADADKEEWDIRDRDEEDFSSEEEGRSSFHNSIGKRGKKRSRSSASLTGKKRGQQDHFGSCPNQMTGDIEGSNSKWAPPQSFTQPQTTNQDLLALKPAILESSESVSRVSSNNDDDASPSSPKRRAHVARGREHHYPPHDYKGPYQPRHQRGSHPDPYWCHPSNIPYCSSYGYHNSRPRQTDPRYREHNPHPPPGWPDNVPFPPPAPYPGQHRFRGGHPPSNLYHPHHHSQRCRNQKDSVKGLQPPNPLNPPLPVRSPVCNRTSSAHLELSVERECAI